LPKARWLKRVVRHPTATSTQKCMAHTIRGRMLGLFLGLLMQQKSEGIIFVRF
jgi:hypothetical protein